MGPPSGRGSRAGRMSGAHMGAGPGSNCVCPNCGEKTPHKLATPCYNLSCPRCGTKMVRE